jgi:hypothetical protein
MMRALNLRPLLHFRLALPSMVALLLACSSDPVKKAPVADTSTEDSLSDSMVLDADDATSTSSDATVTTDGPQDVGPHGLWTQIALPGAHNVDLHGVWSDGTTRVVTVGTNGTILTYDGLQWAVATADHFQTLNAVSGTPGAATAFAVGLKGAILQAAGKDGAPGKVWSVPGGCSKPVDCDDGDPCTTDVCDGGICQHASSGVAGCCGGLAFGDGFEKGMGKWQVSDLYNSGIVWTAAEMTGTDGGKRATSPPKAAYFGRTDVPCTTSAGNCGTFDNGKVVGSTMTSPEFQVPAAAKVTLSFQLLLDVGSSFDQLQVRVLPASEIVWNRQVAYPTGSTDGQFKLQTVDLTKFAGQKIKLEVRFDSQTASDNAGEGAFIDDLAIASTCAGGSGAGSGVTSATLFGVWSAAPDDAWAVGAEGAIVHWDGQAWALVDAGIPETLRAVWGPNGGDVWAVGEKGAIYHNTGEGWLQTPIEDYQPEGAEKPYKVESTLLTVWGAAPDDVWASGLPDANGKGVFVHWDGNSWTYAPIFMDESRTVRAIWGWSKDRILVAGTQGMVYQFDGQQTFAKLQPGTIATLFGVTGFGKDALLVGDIGTVLRYTPLSK